MAQGFDHTNDDAVCFSFVGDSTFFASGMTGVVNAVYNESDTIICVLDNSTTAMTGHQPHPGTGRNMMGNIVDKVDIAKILEGMGVKKVLTLNTFELEKCIDSVRECADIKGVKAIIFKSPCIALTKPDKRMKVERTTCVGCKKCILETGCPALSFSDGKAVIDHNLCTGCSLCSSLCPVGAIGGQS